MDGFIQSIGPLFFSKPWGTHMVASLPISIRSLVRQIAATYLACDLSAHFLAMIGVLTRLGPTESLGKKISVATSEVGGCSTRKSFRFVRACVRAVWLPSGIGSKVVLASLFPFPFLSG